MKTINLWPWAAALCVVAGIGAMQHLDDVEAAVAAQHAANDARLAAVKARREEMARREFCLKAHGPASAPVEQEDGGFRCIGKRGQRGQLVALQ